MLNTIKGAASFSTLPVGRSFKTLYDALKNPSNLGLRGFEDLGRRNSELAALAAGAGYIGGNLTINSITWPVEIYPYFGNTTFSANKSFGHNINDDKLIIVYVVGNMTVAASYTLTTVARKLGLIFYVQGDLTVEGAITMTAKGANYASPAGNLRLFYDSGASEIYIPSAGASGGAQVTGNGDATFTTNGNAGTAGTGGQCGGGGGGGAENTGTGYPGNTITGGAGGDASGFSGGAGGGGGSTGGLSNAVGSAGGNNGAYGGSAAASGLGTPSAGGGAGNPAGSGSGAAGATGDTGVGGLLIAMAEGDITIESGGEITSNGEDGGDVSSGGAQAGGGGSGAGSVNLFPRGSYTNDGTVTADGGTGGTANATGGDGGDGTVRTATALYG